MILEGVRQVGMYDTITIDHEMIPKRWRGHAFQTKSLDCFLDGYRIDIDGQLWKEPNDLFEGEQSPELMRDDRTCCIRIGERHPKTLDLRFGAVLWIKRGVLTDIDIFQEASG